ncbi:MAG: hypothetical protein ABW185_05080 [Sedimenticola sp.]
MEKVKETEVSAAKSPRCETDFTKCVICQTITDEQLIDAPVAHEKLFLAIKERAQYGDGEYTIINNRLGQFTVHELQSKSATWHARCYKVAVHTGMLQRAKRRYEKQVESLEMKRKSNITTSPETNILTRSQSLPFDNSLCFFCERGNLLKNPLFKVATVNAGQKLKEAIEKSGNERLHVKLCSAINLEDAHAIDIRYHKNCWTSHVFNVIRPSHSESHEADPVDEIAAKIEFLSAVDEALQGGIISNMSILQDEYENIRKQNNVPTPTIPRKKLKTLLQEEIPDIEFHKPKRVNEPERVTIKQTTDKAVQIVEDMQKDTMANMKALYEVALFLRKAISKTKVWKFTGALDDTSAEHTPNELYSFFRWILQGPRKILSNKTKSSEVDKRATTLAQNTVALYLSDRQVTNTSKTVHSVRESPQQLAVGLSVRKETRSKRLINMLHGFGISTDYGRLLRIETQIADTIIQQMTRTGGLYIPHDIVQHRHIFFAVDNIDFQEDTPDGHGTLHATVMSVYQKVEAGDRKPNLELTGSAKERSLKDVPEITTQRMNCPDPPQKPPNPVYNSYSLQKNDDVHLTLPEIVWIHARTQIRDQDEEIEIIDNVNQSLLEATTEQSAACTNEQTQPVKDCTPIGIPTWSAYQSEISEKLPVVRVGAFPLLAAPAHEWSTLLTILMHAQGINTQILGDSRRTVISLDMGLYKPAKQLQMSRNDMDHLILRPGELHIVMAQLRTIGSYIEGSGIDLCWTEANLYGPATVKQIIEGRHIVRGQTAHTLTLEALFSLYQDEFFRGYPEIKTQIIETVEKLDKAFRDDDTERVKSEHLQMCNIICSQNVMEKMHAFDKAKSEQPLFCVMRHYMEMILQMLMFIRAVRTGNWELHLVALEMFTKYFFAHDRINYSRMIPLYLAEMKSLKTSDPDIYCEMMEGNWVVNKNSTVSFCAIGADHALEQINRSMKVSGGLVGISHNPSARAKFFLISPELARLATEAQQMAGVKAEQRTRHHGLSKALLARHEKNIQKLTATLVNFTNPFAAEGVDLYNLVTKLVAPEQIKVDLCQHDEIGRKLFESFVADRIQNDVTNLWSPMKKRKLATWKNAAKKVNIPSVNKVVELKEDRSLFARLLVVCKSRPEINLKDARQIRVLRRSQVIVCSRWEHASLFYEEQADEHLGGCSQKI